MGLNEEHVGGRGDDAAAGTEAVDGGKDASGDAGFDDADDVGVAVAVGGAVADAELGGVSQALIDDEGQVEGGLGLG